MNDKRKGSNQASTILRAALTLIVGCVWTVSAVSAQTPRVAPAQGFVLLEETVVDRFIVQRWVSGTNPEVSPAGYCECINQIYEGSRLVFDLGIDGGITHVTATSDVTGDRRAELVINTNSGGAHCCQATAIYSVGDATPRQLLSLNTGDCSGELIDLDKDGTAEFQTCDAAYAYAFCSFAFSPLPPVVFAYDRQKAEYVLVTPKFARRLQLRSVSEARQMMAEYRDDPALVRCAALGPALGLIYTGRVAQGQRLFRQLYRGPDAIEVERKALEMAMKSALWSPR
jgi:hypothetical protein